MPSKVSLEAVLLYPLTRDHIGLGLKKKKIGAGLLNGWGGIIEGGEGAIASVVREVREEGGVNIHPADLQKRALVLFHNERFDCEVHVFLANWNYPDLRESDEMGALEWFSRASPPYERMMLADKEWLPRVLNGEKIRGEVWYGPGQKSLLRESVYTNPSFIL